jgi:hypothetical protein
LRLSIFFTITFFLIYGQNLSAQTVWVENSFEDFVDGTFDDGGANWYVSKKGYVQMINRWDVNNDGNIDILCANSHPLVEMLDMSIYWGNGKDYSIRNHSYVPANGPMWVAPGDLNGDGEPDLVVANYSNGTWTEMPSFVYYGGLKDKNQAPVAGQWAFYPFKERIELPGSNAQKPAIGDLNRDGYPDIVFAFSGGFWEYRDKSKEGSSPSRIYWGSKEGYDPQNFTNIQTMGATDVVIADLNKDDWPDLVFANGQGESSYLYYGAEEGYSASRLVELPTVQAHAVKAGDVDNDGWTDLVFANEAGRRSFAYLNEKGYFNRLSKIEFETYAAKDVVVADFNKDTYNDIFFTNHQFSLTGDPKQADRLIDSYLYYGSADGFKKENRQSIPTIGAWGANCGDLNGDGWIDLLVCNFQEHYSYEVPSFIYWNGPQGFTETLRTPLYEHGAQGNAIADFNNDGYPDILITSMMGNSRGDYDPNYLYFGKDNGQYTVADRLELPGREAYEQGFADLDDDGQVDILLLNRGEVTREVNELWIYWNSDNRFNPWRMSGLPSYAGLGVEVADLDRDGYLDIIISNGHAFPGLKKGDTQPGSFIYWGSAQGWPVTERSVLPIVQTRAVAVCDLDANGQLDLVFGQQGPWGDASVFYGNGTREFSEKQRVFIKGSSGSGTPGVADLDKDGRLDIAFAHDKNVLIYYQQENGEFPPEKSQKVPVSAKTMCVADVNQDGWLDLICPFYTGDGKRSWFSTVLLGSREGYTLEHAIKLPTDGGTGSIASDFNRDGFMDIFFFCHRHDGRDDQIGKFGDHHTNSLLYWGSAGGFDAANRLEIPSVGAHYDVGIDIGHIKDRSFVYKYTSSIFETGKKSAVDIAWTGETPQHATIKLQLRSALTKTELAAAPWLGAQGEGSTFDNPAGNKITLPPGGYLQYRAVFETDNGAYSAVLKEVKITLE